MQVIKSGSTVSFRLYDRFHITIPLSEWDFMCSHRWLTDSPDQEDVDAEFGVCGARSARDDWEATAIVRDTIAALHNLMTAESFKSAPSGKKFVVRVSDVGSAYYTEEIE